MRTLEEIAAEALIPSVLYDAEKQYALAEEAETLQTPEAITEGTRIRERVARMNFDLDGLRQCMEAYERVGTTEARAEAHLVRGVLAENNNDRDLAFSEVHQALEIAVKNPDKTVLGRAHSFLGSLLAQFGEREDSYAQYVQAQEIFQELGDARLLSYVNRSLAEQFVSSVTILQHWSSCTQPYR